MSLDDQADASLPALLRAASAAAAESQAVDDDDSNMDNKHNDSSGKSAASRSLHELKDYNNPPPRNKRKRPHDDDEEAEVEEEQDDDDSEDYGDDDDDDENRKKGEGGGGQPARKRRRLLASAPQVKFDVDDFATVDELKQRLATHCSTVNGIYRISDVVAMYAGSRAQQHFWPKFKAANSWAQGLVVRAAFGHTKRQLDGLRFDDLIRIFSHYRNSRGEATRKIVEEENRKKKATERKQLPPAAAAAAPAQLEDHQQQQQPAAASSIEAAIAQAYKTIAASAHQAKNVYASSSGAISVPRADRSAVL
jgi:hypothetical protein